MRRCGELHYLADAMAHPPHQSERFIPILLAMKEWGEKELG